MARADFAKGMSLNAQFDKTELKQILVKYQKSSAHYSEFCADIAQAGVKEYSVSVTGRTVTYKGISAKEYTKPIA